VKELCECCGLECEGTIYYNSASDLWCCAGCSEVLKAQQAFDDSAWRDMNEDSV
jgi:hypothetical protein